MSRILISCNYVLMLKQVLHGTTTNSNNNDDDNNNIITRVELVTVRSRFLGGKDNFLKCLKQLFFGIVYSQKFPIIASIIIAGERP